MGAFFTNLQVRATAEGDLARLVSFYEAHLGAIGFRAVEGDGLADRTIVIARAGSWIAVYDEATDTGAEDLSSLAETISARLDAAVVAIRIHDSDVLDLDLFEAGERRDRYCSAPSYFAEIADSERQEVAGKPAAWKSFLADGKNEADLRRVFDEKLLFAERTLHEIGDLIAIERSHVGTGYRYTVDGHGPTAEVTLRFRSEVRPAHETLAEGTPRLVPRYGMDRLETRPPTAYELMVGSPAQIAATARNAGGKGVGVEVWVEGEALERGLVGVKAMNVVMGSPLARCFAEATPEERRDGARLRVVGTFPDAPIPAGFVGDLDELMRARPDKMVEIMHATNVHTNVHLEAHAPGVADLKITVVAIEGAESPHVEEAVITVAKAAPRPLRARSEVHPHQLAPFLGRTTAFLLVSFDSSRDEAAALAASYFSEWKSVLGEAKNLHATIFHQDEKLAPTTKRGFDLGKLQETMRSTQVVTLATAAMVHRGGTSGLSFGTRILPPPAGDASLCPTLALWADVSKVPTKRGRYEDMLASIADRAIANGKGIQAIVGAWAWAPTTLDSTPYEEVCGIHGGTLARSWLTRFVRAIAPGRLWLGPDLTARVDRAAVAAVAPVADCGAGLRIDVEDDAASIRAVEEALAPLLPTMDDSFAAVRAERG